MVQNVRIAPTDQILIFHAFTDKTIFCLEFSQGCIPVQGVKEVSLHSTPKKLQIHRPLGIPVSPNSFIAGQFSKLNISPEALELAFNIFDTVPALPAQHQKLCKFFDLSVSLFLRNHSYSRTSFQKLQVLMFLKLYLLKIPTCCTCNRKSMWKVTEKTTILPPKKDIPISSPEGVFQLIRTTYFPYKSSLAKLPSTKTLLFLTSSRVKPNPTNQTKLFMNAQPVLSSSCLRILCSLLFALYE